MSWPLTSRDIEKQVIGGFHRQILPTRFTLTGAQCSNQLILGTSEGILQHTSVVVCLYITLQLTSFLFVIAERY